MRGPPQQGASERAEVVDPLWSRFEDRADRIEVAMPSTRHADLQEVARFAWKGDFTHD